MYTKRDYHYFNIAKELAALSMHYKSKIGAVIVNNGDIISSAFNIQKSHPLQAKYNVLRNLKSNHTVSHSLHAEMAAIIKADKSKLNGASIYIHRVSVGKPKQKFLMCKPCNACSQALFDFGIKQFFYTTEDGFCHD